MKCKNCGLPITKEDNICPHCGQRIRKTWKYILVSLASLLLVAGMIFAILTIKDQTADDKKPAPQQEPIDKIQPIDDPDDENDKLDKPEEKTPTDEQKPSEPKEENTEDKYIVGEETLDKNQHKSEKQVMELEQKADITNYIDRAKKSVFTITTPEMQGSGFLFDWNGAIVTNAHVVEGWTEAKVIANDNTEYQGYLIGYSNETDVAVIHVPELKGTKPFPHDVAADLEIGEEIVALGSPNGERNSATMGFITGKNRDFVIGSFIYNNLYQISAPIAPGSSGGPLISKQSEKIIAINSAQSTTDHSIGFSIPMYQVSGLIQSWIDSPMSENDLFDLFYGEDGDLVIGDEWDEDEGYFEEGDYSEDEEHYDYWEYEYEEYQKEQNKEDSEDAQHKDTEEANKNTEENESDAQTDEIDKETREDDTNKEKPQDEQEDEMLESLLFFPSFYETYKVA